MVILLLLALVMIVLATGTKCESFSDLASNVPKLRDLMWHSRYPMIYDERYRYDDSPSIYNNYPSIGYAKLGELSTPILNNYYAVVPKEYLHDYIPATVIQSRKHLQQDQPRVIMGYDSTDYWPLDFASNYCDPNPLNAITKNTFTNKNMYINNDW